MHLKVSNITRHSFLDKCLVNGRIPPEKYLHSQEHTIHGSYGKVSGDCTQKITLWFIFFYEEGVLELDDQVYFLRRKLIDYVLNETMWQLYNFDSQLEQLEYRKRYIHNVSDFLPTLYSQS